MSQPADRLADGVATYFEPEPFRVVAERELAAAPLWQRGVCFNPGCRQAFNPARDWQLYCWAACERAGVTEFREWGHRMALPLLAWRSGKNAPAGSPQGDLTRAARR